MRVTPEEVQQDYKSVGLDVTAQVGDPINSYWLGVYF